MGASDYQSSKTVMFQVGTIATNATSATTIDCLGERFAQLEVFTSLATATNSSAKWTALKLQHGTTTDATNHSDVTGAVGTTNATTAAGEFVLPEHNNTAAGGVVRFDLDLTKLERILRVEKHAAASHHTTANVIHFYRSPLAPVTDANRRVDKSVQINTP